MTAGPRGAVLRFRQLDALRERVAAAFGVPPPAREALVVALLADHRKDAPSYWLQLLVSMGIATLGLVVGSDAVVIGAMLISPLMGPLVELGMGLAVGSAVMLGRTFFRTIASIAVVVAGAALMTLLLPFHELTPTIASRTAPTVLDLFVAALCAVMAAFTTIRSSTGAASTAAGTAIAIALVPPLSVVGWGMGSRRWDVMRGAALLFTANLFAIVLLTVLIFVFLGFNRIAVGAIEEQGVAPHHRSERFAAQLRSLLGSRYGVFLRWVIPLALFAAVFVPLRRALKEVVWQVQVRSQVQALVDRLAPPDQSVHSTVTVGSHRVTVRLVILGDARRAAQVEDALRRGIAETTDVTPALDVVAVPDVGVLDRVAAEVQAPAPAPPPAPPVPDPDWLRGIVREHLADAWPESEAGPLLSWDLRIDDRPTSTLDVLHLGRPLAPSAIDVLGREVSRELGSPVVVVDRWASPEPSTARPEDGAAWFPTLVRDARVAEEEPRLWICVTAPAAEQKPAIARSAGPLEDAVRAVLSKLPEARRSLSAGEQWSTRLSLQPCVSVDAGSATDASSALDATAPDAPAATSVVSADASR